MSRALIGGVMIDVIDIETPEMNNEITDKPVENGSNVSDHIRQLPTVLQITGKVTGPNAPATLSKLRRFRDRGTLVTFVHRNVFTSMGIENFNTDHEKTNRQGFNFNMTLKQVRITTPRTAEVVAPVRVATGQTSTAGASGTSTQVKSDESMGRQQTESKESDAGTRNSVLLNLSSQAGGYLGRFIQ